MEPPSTTSIPRTNKSRTYLLSEARRRLGLPSHADKRLVAQAAACLLGLKIRPRSKSDCWAVVERFLASGLKGEMAYRFGVSPGDRSRSPKPKATALPPSAGSFSDAFIISDEFLSTYEWRKLRMVVLTKRGARCECCGATAKDGVRIHVDHIKPRRHYPGLALIESNLQVLCEVCNHGKGSWDETDWRVRAEVGESSKDSPVPDTATGDERKLSTMPRLVRRS